MEPTCLEQHRQIKLKPGVREQEEEEASFGWLCEPPEIGPEKEKKKHNRRYTKFESFRRGLAR